MAQVTCLHRQGYFAKAAELLKSAVPLHPFDEILQTLTASILDVRLCKQPRAAHDRADEAWERYQSIRDLHTQDEAPILGLATQYEIERLHSHLLLFGIGQCERPSVLLQDALNGFRDSGQSLLLKGAVPESFMALSDYAKLAVGAKEEIEHLIRLADEGYHNIEHVRIRLFLAEFLIDDGYPAIDVIQEAYDLAEQYAYPVGITKASFLKCKCDVSPFGVQLSRLQELLENFAALDCTIGLANVYTYASSMAVQYCDLPTVISIISTSLKFFHSVGFIAGEIFVQQKMAEKYVLLGHSDAAESILTEAFELTCSRLRVSCATALSQVTSLSSEKKQIFWAKQGYDTARILHDNDDMLVCAVVVYANALYDSDPEEASQLILDQLYVQIRACRFVNTQKLLLLLCHKSFYGEKYLYYFAENLAKISIQLESAIPPQIYHPIHFLELKFCGHLAFKMGHMEEAEKHLEESLSVFPDDTDSKGGSFEMIRLMAPSRYSMQGMLASVLAVKGNIEKALNLFAQAISNAQASGSFKGTAHLLISRGQLCLFQFLDRQCLDDSDTNVKHAMEVFRVSALADFKLAEKLFDQMRLDYVALRLPQSLEKKGVMNLESRSLYEHMLRLQLAQDDRKELWHCIQASKARSLLDLLGV